MPWSHDIVVRVGLLTVMTIVTACAGPDGPAEGAADSEAAVAAEGTAVESTEDERSEAEQTEVDQAEGERSAAEMVDVEMAAVSIREFGSPEVLRVERIARPQPGENELLVRVHAASVNPVDTGARASGGAGFLGVRLPYIPGFDLSGTVVAIGGEGSRFDVGDEVFAMIDLGRGGAYAEYAIVRMNEAAWKPESVSHVEAAAVPLVALTAWQALFDTAELEPGQSVLIHGGAGGVGSVAVQLAKWRGARIIATASPRNHDFLRDLGVDVVVDYNTQRFEDFAQDVDVVLDPIGGDTQIRSLGVLREGGILVSIVGLTSEARSPDREIRTTSILVEPDSAQLGRIAELIDSGEFRPVVTHRFPLDAAPEAHTQSETGHTRGKIVLVVVPEG